ncbi:MAG: RhuM family protein [Polyangia bacterium]
MATPKLVRRFVRKSDVAIAKNYLKPDELDALNRIVTAYSNSPQGKLNCRPTIRQTGSCRSLRLSEAIT